MADRQNGMISMKRLGVDKANARIVAITAGAAFLVIFFLVGSYSLFGQLTYQNRIISAKREAVNRLKKNIEARDSLVTSYTSFAKADLNIIGGSSSGAGAKDGANPKLVLDALPGKYDFPALTSSLEKIANDEGVSIEGISGIDDEVAQQGKQESDPTPVAMPFELTLAGSYLSVQRTVDAFDKSIRPVQIQKLSVSGDPNKVTMMLTAQTYYQPSKALNIKTKVVK